MTVRIMTYNLLDGGGRKGERLETLLEIARQQAPDVLGVQECNGFDADGQQVLFEWERALGMRGVLCETRTGYHVGLFVRGARLVAAHRPTDWFHHGSVRAKMELGGKALTVIVTHLCPFSGESRVREVQYLTTHVRDENVVVMGDMNSISRRDLAHLPLDRMLSYRKARHLVPGTDTVDTRAMDVFEGAGLVDLYRKAHPDAPGCTLPTPLVDGSSRPELRVDYLFGSPAVAECVSRCEVLVDDETRRASDHFPVVADVEL